MEVGPGSSAAGGTECVGGWLGLEGAELGLARGGERSGLGDAELTWAGPVSEPGCRSGVGRRYWGGAVSQSFVRTRLPEFSVRFWGGRAGSVAQSVEWWTVHGCPPAGLPSAPPAPEVLL